MVLVVVNQIYEGLELGRADEEEPAFLLDQAVLDLLLGDERDRERVGNSLADSDQKRPIDVDPRQDVLGLLPAPGAVEPGLKISSVSYNYVLHLSCCFNNGQICGFSN